MTQNGDDLMHTNGKPKRRPIPRNRLTELRERHKHKPGGFWLTATEMARARGIGLSMVSMHENHQRPLTDRDVEEYSRILKVKPHKIFVGLTQN
jgi:phosphoribosylformylglycinamidine (FGAM) synthase-like enzyme